MALGKSYVAGLVKKAPSPDKMDAMGDMAGAPGESDEPKDPADVDGDEAAKASAFDDFVSALGLSPAKAAKARNALDEYLSLCK
jgi:hypothetical protein